DESAPFHSITSSARSRIAVGIVTPSALAALRLTTVSNAVRSAGFSPLRIRPVWTPAAHAAAPRNNGPDAASEKGGGMDSGVGGVGGAGRGVPTSSAGVGGGGIASPPNTTSRKYFSGSALIIFVPSPTKKPSSPKLAAPSRAKNKPAVTCLKASARRAPAST